MIHQVYGISLFYERERKKIKNCTDKVIHFIPLAMTMTDASLTLFFSTFQNFKPLSLYRFFLQIFREFPKNRLTVFVTGKKIDPRKGADLSICSQLHRNMTKFHSFQFNFFMLDKIAFLSLRKDDYIYLLYGEETCEITCMDKFLHQKWLSSYHWDLESSFRASCKPTYSMKVEKSS